MKKLMLTIAGLLLVSVMAVNAQVTQDTTQTPTEQPTVTDPSQTTPTDPSQTTPTESPNFADDQNMELIQATDVPASLRSTLQGSEYRGWENGMIYRDKTTNEYVVQIGEGTDRQTYRFDSNGKRVDEK